MKYIKFFISGLLFGVILLKAEVVSWYRIQEMFMFQSFHMYGIIMSALGVATVSILILKKLKVKTWRGEPIIFPVKPHHKGVLAGGIIFGLGWSVTGACPGPMYALVGFGYPVMIITLISALIGTFVYGLFKEKLPH